MFLWGNFENCTKKHTHHIWLTTLNRVNGTTLSHMWKFFILWIARSTWIRREAICCVCTTSSGVIRPLLPMKGGMLKGQCPDYVHARASSVFSSKDNRTVTLTRQDFFPDRTADGALLFTFSSNMNSFVLFKIWLAARRLITILSQAGPPRDPKISFRSL